MLKYLIHWYVVKGREVSFVSFQCGSWIFPEPLIENVLFAVWFLVPLLEISWLWICGLILFLWCRFLFSCQCRAGLLTRALMHILKSSIVLSPALFFLFKIAGWFRDFCGIIWILGLHFLYRCWVLWRWHWICRLLEVVWHFNNINSNPWTWDIFPFIVSLQFLSSVFLSFQSRDLSPLWLKLFPAMFSF